MARKKEIKQEAQTKAYEKYQSYLKQAKKLKIEDNLIKSGVIVRHLILPLCSSDSIEILKWFNDNKKEDTYLSIMAQ